MGTIVSYETEGTIYGKYILQSAKDAKIGVLYQNDDLGRDYFKGLQEGFGEQAKAAIVKAVSYELTDPTIDSQIINLKASGANVFFNASSPRFAAQAIRKAFDIEWRPTHFLSLTGSLIPAALVPTGVENREPSDVLAFGGYGLSQTMIYILEKCGNNLTRENVMYQATHMHDVEFPILLPGIKINTSPTNYRGYNQMQLVKFDGKRWVPFGEIIGE
jgi:hypothetical protein